MVVMEDKGMLVACLVALLKDINILAALAARVAPVAAKEVIVIHMLEVMAAQMVVMAAWIAQPFLLLRLPDNYLPPSPSVLVLLWQAVAAEEQE